MLDHELLDALELRRPHHQEFHPELSAPGPPDHGFLYANRPFMSVGQQ